MNDSRTVHSADGRNAVQLQISNSRSAASDRLDSWKEIAAYLGRSVRCAQRWERILDLPVHRLLHTEGYSVYAYIEELESWRRSREKAAGTALAATIPTAEAAILREPHAPPPLAVSRILDRPRRTVNFFMLPAILGAARELYRQFLRGAISRSSPS